MLIMAKKMGLHHPVIARGMWGSDPAHKIPHGKVDIKGNLRLKTIILGNSHGERGYFVSSTFLKKMQNGVKHLAKISKKLEEILFQNTLFGPYLAQYLLLR